MAKKTENIKFCDFIKEARIAVGVTQAEVSQDFGYTTAQFVSNWERGLSHPPVNVIKRLAALYKMSADEMFDIYLNEVLETTKTDLERKFKASR